MGSFHSDGSLWCGTFGKRIHNFFLPVGRKDTVSGTNTQCQKYKGLPLWWLECFHSHSSEVSQAQSQEGNSITFILEPTIIYIIALQTSPCDFVFSNVPAPTLSSSAGYLQAPPSSSTFPVEGRFLLAYPMTWG